MQLLGSSSYWQTPQATTTEQQHRKNRKKSSSEKRNRKDTHQRVVQVLFHVLHVALDALRGTLVPVAVLIDGHQRVPQLLVLDHGDGWLSLYAHNRSLLRKVGDRINAGQTIARAGASGGSETPGLYFEIRHQGKPVDPADWIRR